MFGPKKVKKELSLICALIISLMTIGQASFAQCTQSQKIVANDADKNDALGYSVSVNGDLAVIGAYYDTAMGVPGAGSAYVFRFDGADWVQEQKLSASDGEQDASFGWSVCADENTIVVGALLDDAIAVDSGAAYVFRFNGANWVEEQKLTASNGGANHLFGGSVSVSSDWILIGGGGHSDGPATETAYMFRFDGADWVQAQKLIASDTQPFDLFGVSVAVSGETAVVGAPFDNCITVPCGSAYAFRYNGTTWIEEEKLTASDAVAHQLFGFNVASDGCRIVVGAPGLPFQGWGLDDSAYIYWYNGTTWIEEKKLSASDAAAGDDFGLSVSISGDTVLIGAVLDDCVAGSDCGSAYVFKLYGANWVEAQKLTAFDGAADDWFGFSVAVSGNVAAVGAFQDGCAGVGKYCGSAYMFSCIADMYGDVNGDQVVDLADLVCVLDGFRGNFGVCSMTDVDIMPLGGNGVVDLFDILGVLDAYGGIPFCE